MVVPLKGNIIDIKRCGISVNETSLFISKSQLVKSKPLWSKYGLQHVSRQTAIKPVTRESTHHSLKISKLLTIVEKSVKIVYTSNVVSQFCIWRISIRYIKRQYFSFVQKWYAKKDALLNKNQVGLNKSSSLQSDLTPEFVGKKSPPPTLPPKKPVNESG